MTPRESERGKREGGMRIQREPDKKLAMEGEEKGGEIYSLKVNGRIRNWPLPLFLQQHIDSCVQLLSVRDSGGRFYREDKR